jgi:hypothetical protein
MPRFTGFPEVLMADEVLILDAAGSNPDGSDPCRR